MILKRIYQMLTSILILAAAAFGSESPGASAGEGDQPSQKDLKALATACLSHRESFPSMTCKFTYIQGEANGLDRAIRGQAGDIQISNTSTARWIVDKQSVLFEQLADPAILEQAKATAEKAGALSFSVPVVSHGLLTDGSLRLRYSQGLAGAEISGPDAAPRPDMRFTPFAMNLMGKNEEFSPGNMLIGCVGGKMTCVSMTTEKVDGHEIIVVELLHPRQTRYRYWLDPQRGFLPIKCYFLGNDGKEITRAYWTDIRKCSGNRWFPWRGVNIRTYGVTDPDKSAGSFRVEEIRVNSLDVDKPPKRDSFRLVLPIGTQVHSELAKGAIHTKEDETVGLDDLPKLMQRLIDWGEIVKAAEAQHRAETAGQWRFGIITAIMATVIGVAALVRWRWVARRRPAPASGELPSPANP
jgi:hypothetical protein